MTSKPSTNKVAKKRSPRPAPVAEEAPGPAVAPASGAPPPEIMLELDAGPERSAYEHGIEKYLKKPPSYLSKTQLMMSLASLKSPQSCLKRNLPGILIITIVLVVAAAVYMELADFGGSEDSSVYPTPETTVETKDENATGTRDDVEAILQEAQKNFLRQDEEER
ncbi:uncharacterized protein LOC144105743 [Amblyomma americanum]